MIIKDMLPLDQLLQHRARLSSRKTFIKFEGAAYSFREMDRLAGVYAAYLLEQGMKRGDRVALLSQNNPYYVAAYFGIIRAGGIVLPLNHLLAHEEIDFILNDAGAETCFFDHECSGTIEKLRGKNSRSYVLLDDVASAAGIAIPVLPTPAHGVDDISTILYTSGTTGSPKGALLTHRNIMSNALACAAAIHISPKDRFIVFLPLFHSFTFTVCVVIPLVTGSLISLLPGVRPFSRVVKRLILDRITLFVAIPTVYKILAEKNMPFLVKMLLNLRLCVCGAAPLPVKVIKDFEAAFKVPVIEGYGLTEASPVVAINPDDHGRRRPGTVGLPLPGLEVRVVDDEGKPLATGEPGELLVKGPSVMMGYLNRPEDTAKAIRDNWLSTGDIASLDADGYIRIIDRKKDMIIVDGLNVYPFEVEEVLYRHHAVKDCAMIGVLHGEDKEIPIMYVVQKDGQQATAKAFRDFLSEHVAHYKIPRRFLMIDELPRTATGKILKKEIRKLYLATEMKPPV